MTRRRTLIVCPGRGSYARATLGSLAGRSAAAEAVIEACDRWRHDHDRPGVRALDAETSFRSALHLAGEHASLLTFACSLADLADLDRTRHEVVGVCGNSMGWYTALAASGALSLEDAIALVDTMGWYQQGSVVGGQLMYPAWDAAGATGPGEAALHIVEAGQCAGLSVYLSIDLGSHLVLAGDEPGLAFLERELPPIESGERTFPSRLPMHSAFHTPLMNETSARALRELDLRFRAPETALTDGRGQVFRPVFADPSELRAYTLGTQVVEPYGFRTGLLAALRHSGAERVVVLGPGNSLGGPIARILIAEGWRGLRDRSQLDAAQREDPVLLSFGVAPQRAALVAG